jgi:hypothetical protein
MTERRLGWDRSTIDALIASLVPQRYRANTGHLQRGEPVRPPPALRVDPFPSRPVANPRQEAIHHREAVRQ